MSTADPLAQLVAAVQASPKYRYILPDLVQEVGARELANTHNLKEAVKATRSKLHQVAAVYLDADLDYAHLTAELAELPCHRDNLALRDFCRRAMAGHASTRERLPILEQFFAQTLAGIAPLHSVLDLACGLNPLALPWMPLADDATYLAYDIFTDMAAFLDEFFRKVAVAGRGRVCNLARGAPEVLGAPEVHGAPEILGASKDLGVPEELGAPEELEAPYEAGDPENPRAPDKPVQVAFLLKALPCLEQLDKNLSARLLATIRAEHILVSFPARSLGGHPKGMLTHYEAHLNELTAGLPWRIQRFEFATELAFLLSAPS